MKSFILSNETGWLEIPGDTKLVIAHYKDGHTERFTIVEFLAMKKDKIARIDCYAENERTEDDEQN